MQSVPLEICQIGHSYGSVRALEAVSFELGQAELFALLGPNGGGKTTLFRILCTLMRPDQGTARVFGWDLLTNPAQVRRQIGIVFQSSTVDGKLSARENMRHQGHLYGLRGKELERRIEVLLERVGLLDRAGDAVEKLSGGQRRRVELAKGLLHGPKLLLLDEPTTGLDPVARRDLWSYLHILREKDGVSALVTTHLMDEAELCDRVAIIHHGRLVACGTPLQLKHEIEGEVLVVEASDSERLRRTMIERFHLTPQVVGNSLRIERSQAHQFVPVLMQAFPEEICSVTLARPTLEDVFIHRTGQRFESLPPQA
jgi:ABC-2 type transport system ATP-binding protein